MKLTDYACLKKTIKEALRDFLGKIYTKMDQYLPLSGGTVTGNLDVKKDLTVSGELLVASDNDKLQFDVEGDKLRLDIKNDDFVSTIKAEEDEIVLHSREGDDKSEITVSSNYVSLDSEHGDDTNSWIVLDKDSSVIDYNTVIREYDEDDETEYKSEDNFSLSLGAFNEDPDDHRYIKLVGVRDEYKNNEFDYNSIGALSIRDGGKAELYTESKWANGRRKKINFISWHDEFYFEGEKEYEDGDSEYYRPISFDVDDGELELKYLVDPEDDGDAVSLGYLNERLGDIGGDGEYLPLSGGTVEGALNVVSGSSTFKIDEDKVEAVVEQSNQAWWDPSLTTSHSSSVSFYPNIIRFEKEDNGGNGTDTGSIVFNNDRITLQEYFAYDGNHGSCNLHLQPRILNGYGYFTVEVTPYPTSSYIEPYRPIEYNEKLHLRYLANPKEDGDAVPYSYFKNIEKAFTSIFHKLFPDDIYTFDALSAASEMGIYKNIYKIGDLIPFQFTTVGELGSKWTVQMQIVAFDADELADGSGNAHITFISKYAFPDRIHRMNPALVTLDNGYQEGTGAIGGWEKSEMRTYLKELASTYFPSTVTEAIKPVNKSSTGYNTSGDREVVTTVDDVWIPSAKEIYNVAGESGVTYQDAFPSNASRVKQNQSLELASDMRCEWFLRTANSRTNYHYITKPGSNNNTSASTDKSIVFGFCI